MHQHSDLPDDAFGRLVRREEPRVRAYLARRAPPEAVDDVLADVLLVAWRRRDEVPGEPLPWLLGVAAKTLSSRWRAEARRDALVERVARQPAPPQPSVDGEVRRRVQQRALAAALGALDERDRELLLLRFWDDLRPREIAIAFGLPSVTVRARLHRATARLHRHLRAALDEGEPAGEDAHADGSAGDPLPLPAP